MIYIIKALMKKGSSSQCRPLNEDFLFLKKLS